MRETHFPVSGGTRRFAMSLYPGSFVPIYQAESAILSSTALTALHLLIPRFTGSGPLLHLLSLRALFLSKDSGG